MATSAAWSCAAATVAGAHPSTTCCSSPGSLPHRRRPRRRHCRHHRRRHRHRRHRYRRHRHHSAHRPRRLCLRRTEAFHRWMADGARCLARRQTVTTADRFLLHQTVTFAMKTAWKRSSSARTRATLMRIASHTRGSWSKANLRTFPTPTASFTTPRPCQISTRWLAADRSPRRKGTRAPIATSRTRRPRRRTTLYSAASGSAPADGRALALAAPASPCLSLWPSAPRKSHWPRSPTEASAATHFTF